MISRNASAIAALAICGLAAAAAAQSLCEATGPDIVVSHIEGVLNFSPTQSADGVAFATRQTNVGDVSMIANLQTPQHPVQAPNLYRHTFVGGVSRFEQIGMGWCFHAGIPLNMGGFCACRGGSGAFIGPGCSDPHSAGAMAGPANLGPRWGVDAATGQLAHPHATPAGQLPGIVRFRSVDVDAVAYAGASYFAEVVVLHIDEPTENRENNATWRPLDATQSGDNTSFFLAGAVRPGEAAIQAWKSLVPGVSEAAIDVPADGRFILAARVVRVGGNLWHYEYAVYNLNSSRAAAAFVLPRPSGLNIASAGFHDVEYHSGDGPEGQSIVGADWTFGGSVAQIKWETEPYDINPAANALRWGTLYNFRLSCNAAPVPGAPSLELFLPGEPGVLNAALPVPGGPSCLGDHDGDGNRAMTDIFAFLSDWFARNDAGDADGDGTCSVPDIFAFLASWFAGC